MQKNFYPQNLFDNFFKDFLVAPSFSGEDLRCFFCSRINMINKICEVDTKELDISIFLIVYDDVNVEPRVEVYKNQN